MTSAQAQSLPFDAYWKSFRVSDEELEFIFNILLEKEKPLTTDEIAEELVEARLARLEKEAQAATEHEHPSYRPQESYEPGQMLVFPSLKGAVGEVVSVRPGQNPDYADFEVISVRFDDNGREREFAANLSRHRLNEPNEAELAAELDDPERAILSAYGDEIFASLESVLEANDEIVRIAGRWFPRPLIAEIHSGHLNLAEAVLDVAGGGPLPTSDVIEHIELPENIDPLLATFSVDYALQEDERFDEVGPAGQTLWYLRKLEPPEVIEVPNRLQYEPRHYDRSVLTEDLLELEGRLDDELSPLPMLKAEPEEVTLAVLFPHWRVGALPLSSKLRLLFPTAYEAPRIRFILVDGHSGEKFPGWVVRKEGYVFGLKDWYRRYEIPAGGYVSVRAGEAEGEVIVEAVDRRKRNDWIRTVTIAEDGTIGFTMLKQPVGSAYDDLMIVGLVDGNALDEAWKAGSQRRMPDDRLIAHVFRELAKLNPQSAVHAEYLHSGVNVLRRLPPGFIFAELVASDEYEHVGDLYWRIAD